MSAQASGATVEPGVVKSGAAGSAVFPGSDSRKYNYFEPKGRKATHYEDMTVDVQRLQS
ncbi:MAG: toluene hydroxylase, partial [Bradyrhizobium sp.]|nr:toluene hydroxylase [Bradyrhizobium sp.]